MCKNSIQWEFKNNVAKKWFHVKSELQKHYKFFCVNFTFRKNLEHSAILPRLSNIPIVATDCTNLSVVIFSWSRHKSTTVVISFNFSRLRFWKYILLKCRSVLKILAVHLAVFISSMYVFMKNTQCNFYREIKFRTLHIHKFQ